MLLILSQQLRADCSPCNVEQICFEFSIIRGVVPCDWKKFLPCSLTRHSPSLNDGLGMQSHMDQFLPFSQQLSSKHCNSSGSVSDFLILCLGDVNQNFGSRVINMHGPEDSGSVIGDTNVFVLGSSCEGHEYLVHSSWSKGGFDEISDSNCTYKGWLNHIRITRRANYPFYSLAPIFITWGKTFWIRRAQHRLSPFLINLI